MTKTIGILSPGEMGTAIGNLFIEQGHSVVTTLEGRSPKSEARVARSGWTVLPSPAEVVAQATAIFSFVPPQHALGLLTALVEPLASRSSRSGPPAARPLFVDGNSIAPSTAAQLASLCAENEIDFVDASIHGNSTHLATRSVLYLSGLRAAEVAGWFGDTMRVRQLGDDPTRASRFKMTIAGVSKGASALLIEVASVAAEQGLLDEWLTDCRHFYPELFGRMETMLPTYARHSTRRASELAEMATMIRELGLRAGMVEEAGEVVSRLAAHEGSPAFEAVERSTAPLDSFLAALGGVRLLSDPARTSAADFSRTHLPTGDTVSTDSATQDSASQEPASKDSASKNTAPPESISSNREERTDEPTIS